MKLVHHALTDVGRRRTGNEDSFLVRAERSLFLVADGMGGHAAGEVASRVTVETIDEILREGEGEPADRLRKAIEVANERVIAAASAEKKHRGMASTIVAALVGDGEAWIGHAGDSRAYRFRGGAIEQVTSDHSWVNERVQSGAMSLDEARTHPLRNMVTRAVGGRAGLEVEVTRVELAAGDLLLLCSDGLTGMVPEADMAVVLGETPLDVEKAARRLVDAANDHGGDDNITVLLVRVEEEG